ncbi:MAG: efflux RND transporter periplasmic adaptor subunit [Planctomycetota bacterium]
MSRWINVTVVVCFAALVGCEVSRDAKSGPKGGPRGPRATAINVEAAPVRRATIRDVRTLTGSTVPRAYFVVAPKIAGRLEKLTVDIGDRVERGALVAVLDDDEYAQAVSAARAELAVAKANVAQRQSSLATARREYERVSELRRKKIASESQLDLAKALHEAEQARHDVALAQVTQREAALGAAEVRLSYTKIRVSWEEGEEHRVVGERFVDEGAMLSPNTPIVSILDISSLTAVIHVIERDYGKMRPGQKAEITTDACPGRSFEGTVARIAPLLKERSRQARVEIAIPNPERPDRSRGVPTSGPERLLKPGMYVRALVRLAVHENAQTVPIAAVVERKGEPYVFLVQGKEGDRVARMVPVTLGITEGDAVEIVEPELKGHVVTLGHPDLEDGKQVVLPGDKPAKGPAKAEGDRGTGKGK